MRFITPPVITRISATIAGSAAARKLVSPVGAQIVQRPGTAAAYIGIAASG